MSIYKAIVRSMFKHVATEHENSPLVSILQNFVKTFKPVKKSMNYEILQIQIEKLPKMQFFKMVFFVEAVAYIVHSLRSGKVAATPILKSVPSQFSSFIL